MEYKVHNVEWSDEKVKRFWDFFNNYPHFDGLWFSKAVGNGILRFAEDSAKIQGKILDYGAAKGHFINYLLERPDIEVQACDFSEETVSNLNKLYEDRPQFKGCSLVKGFPSAFPANNFDVVFLIEAIEHLTDNYLLPTIEEANRILKPGGTFVVTTPNNEKLEEQHVICPDCGGVFHRVQHVNTFTVPSLKKLMESFGFETIRCEATDFYNFGDAALLHKTKNLIKKTLKKSHELPHLAYIGKKV